MFQDFLANLFGTSAAFMEFFRGTGTGGQPLGRMGFRVKNEFLTCTAKKVKSEICEIFAS